jgi:hypothetical protein
MPRAATGETSLVVFDHQAAAHGSDRAGSAPAPKAGLSRPRMTNSGRETDSLEAVSLGSFSILGGVPIWGSIARFPPDGDNEGWLAVGDRDCRACVPHFPMGGEQDQPIIDLLF